MRVICTNDGILYNKNILRPTFYAGLSTDFLTVVTRSVKLRPRKAGADYFFSLLKQGCTLCGIRVAPENIRPSIVFYSFFIKYNLFFD